MGFLDVVIESDSANVVRALHRKNQVSPIARSSCGLIFIWTNPSLTRSQWSRRRRIRPITGEVYEEKTNSYSVR